MFGYPGKVGRVVGGSAALTVPVPAPGIDYSFFGPLSPDFTFTRGSNATYYDTNGVIQIAASGVPRFDYGDMGGGAPLGMLFEDQRQNLWIQSADWTSTASNASPNDVIKTANAGIAPDGNNTATALIPTTTFGGHNSWRNQAGAINTPYCYSVYCKSFGYHLVYIQLTSTGFPAGITANFDLDAGTILNTGGAQIAVGMIPCRNGWYRCWIAGTSLGSVGNWLGSVMPYTGGSTSCTGDGVSGILVWGGQFEALGSANMPQPTSHIPTLGSTVVRSADTCSLAPGAWFNAAQGTLNAEWLITNRSTTGAGVANAVLEFDDGTTNNIVCLRTANPNAISLNSFTAGASVGGPNGSVGWLQNAIQKSAGWYNGTANALCSNGGAITSSTFTGAIPASFSRMVVGSGRTSAVNGYVRRVRYWNTPLSNAQLQQITR